MLKQKIEKYDVWPKEWSNRSFLDTAAKKERQARIYRDLELVANSTAAIYLLRRLQSKLAI